MTVYYTIGIDDLFPKFVTPRMFISFLSLVLHRRKFRLAFLNAFAASHRLVSSSVLPSLRHLWLEGSNIYSRNMALLLFYFLLLRMLLIGSRRHCPMVRSKSESPEKARDASCDNSNSSREKKRAQTSRVSNSFPVLTPPFSLHITNKKPLGARRGTF